MPKVKCLVCEEYFDRDKVPFVQKGRRYMHRSCAEDPDQIVRCCFCRQIFDKSVTDHVAFGQNLFAHRECKEEDDAREKTDTELLELYLMELFQADFILPVIQKQLKQYYAEFHFTPKGIEQSLRYWTEVLRKTLNPVAGIAIVPPIYKKATAHYQELGKVQQANADKILEDFISSEIEIKIPTPSCKIKKRQLFTFLDKEE